MNQKVGLLEKVAWLEDGCLPVERHKYISNNVKPMKTDLCIFYVLWLVALHSGGTSVFDRRTFPLDLQAASDG